VGVRIAILAQMLTIFDLDDDGIAAWQILKPRGIFGVLHLSENVTTGLEHATTTKNASSLQVTSSEQDIIAIAEFTYQQLYML
jgi:hypothetical protein